MLPFERLKVSGKDVKISAAIVCYNEERNIERCLKSLGWADEIVIVDSFSTDGTVDICKKYTDRVYQREWPGINKQKEYSVSLAENEWVLVIDADEAVSKELGDEIMHRLSADRGGYDGYFMKRHTFYLGRWINHCGWYPDYKLRLFKKDKGYFAGADPHDECFVDGKTTRLKGDLLHFTYQNISHQLKTIDSFSDTASSEMLKKGISLVLPKMIFKPPVKFFETYIYKLGVLDGLPGFIISVLSSYYIFIKFAKLWEKTRLKDADAFSPAP
jgi:glycosyltransferase involved in cell wall biosynthesis